MSFYGPISKKRNPPSYCIRRAMTGMLVGRAYPCSRTRLIDCWGIMFSSVENGVVQNSHLSGPRGIGVHNSDNFQVTENNLSPGETGIGLWDSSSFHVSNNVVYGGGDDTVFLWNVTNFDLSGNSIHSGEVVIFLGFA